MNIIKKVERGGFIEYGAKASTGMPLKCIRKAPTTERPILDGYVLSRTDDCVIERRDDGECAAEAVTFATASVACGDLIEAEVLRCEDLHPPVKHMFESSAVAPTLPPELVGDAESETVWQQMAEVKRMAPPVDRWVGNWRFQLVPRQVGGGSDVYVRSPCMEPETMANRHSTIGSIRSYPELHRKLKSRLSQPQRDKPSMAIADVPVSGSAIFGHSRGISSLHQVNELLQPRFRLQHVAGFEDHNSDLSFDRLYRDLCDGIVIAWALVRCADGALRAHILVVDLWRSLIFLGAGDPDRETLVGVKGITPQDADNLDESLGAIGIVKLQAVRMLWERASAEHAPSGKLTSSQRNAMKRKRQQQG